MPQLHTDTSILAHDLRVVLGKLVRRLREEARLGDLTWPQIQVLGHLDRDGPQTVTQLARVEGMRSQSMGETVASLKVRDLIAGAPDPADGRQTVLSLTDEGRDLILASRASREDWLVHRLNDHLTAAEEAQLAAAIPLLQRLTDE